MKNYDPYKKMILFFVSLINIIMMSAVFAYAWSSVFRKLDKINFNV